MGYRALVKDLVEQTFTGIGDLAETATFHRVTSDGTYNPSTGTTTDTITNVTLPKVVLAKYKKAETDGETIRETDQKVLIPYNDLTTKPETVDYLTINGVRWEIVSVEGVPGDSLWILQARSV